MEKEFPGPWRPAPPPVYYPADGLHHHHRSATGQAREVDFKRWLSITWTDIVDHPNPEERRKHEAAGRPHRIARAPGPAWGTGVG